MLPLRWIVSTSRLLTAQIIASCTTTDIRTRPITCTSTLCSIFITTLTIISNISWLFSRSTALSASIFTILSIISCVSIILSRFFITFFTISTLSLSWTRPDILILSSISLWIRDICSFLTSSSVPVVLIECE